MSSASASLLVEFYGCDSAVLNDRLRLQAVLGAWLQETLERDSYHSFVPQGVSGLLVMGSSRLVIHTWPEYGWATLDLYLRSGSNDPAGGLAELGRQLGAQSVECRRFERRAD